MALDARLMFYSIAAGSPRVKKYSRSLGRQSQLVVNSVCKLQALVYDILKVMLGVYSVCSSQSSTVLL